jgi:hypothetical protein
MYCCVDKKSFVRHLTIGLGKAWILFQYAAVKKSFPMLFHPFFLTWGIGFSLFASIAGNGDRSGFHPCKCKSFENAAEWMRWYNKE